MTVVARGSIAAAVLSLKENFIASRERIKEENDATVMRQAERQAEEAERHAEEAERHAEEAERRQAEKAAAEQEQARHKAEVTRLEIAAAAEKARSEAEAAAAESERVRLKVEREKTEQERLDAELVAVEKDEARIKAEEAAAQAERERARAVKDTEAVAALKTKQNAAEMAQLTEQNRMLQKEFERLKVANVAAEQARLEAEETAAEMAFKVTSIESEQQRAQKARKKAAADEAHKKKAEEEAWERRRRQEEETALTRKAAAAAVEAAWQQRAQDKALRKLKVAFARIMRGETAMRIHIWGAAVAEAAQQKTAEEEARRKAIAEAKDKGLGILKIAFAKIMRGELGMCVHIWYAGCEEAALQKAAEEKERKRATAKADTEAQAEAGRREAAIQLKITLAGIMRGELGSRMQIWRSGAEDNAEQKEAAEEARIHTVMLKVTRLLCGNHQRGALWTLQGMMKNAQAEQTSFRTAMSHLEGQPKRNLSSALAAWQRCNVQWFKDKQRKAAIQKKRELSHSRFTGTKVHSRFRGVDAVLHYRNQKQKMLTEERVTAAKCMLPEPIELFKAISSKWRQVYVLVRSLIRDAGENLDSEGSWTPSQSRRQLASQSVFVALHVLETISGPPAAGAGNQNHAGITSNCPVEKDARVPDDSRVAKERRNEQRRDHLKKISNASRHKGSFKPGLVPFKSRTAQRRDRFNVGGLQELIHVVDKDISAAYARASAKEDYVGSRIARALDALDAEARDGEVALSSISLQRAGFIGQQHNARHNEFGTLLYDTGSHFVTNMHLHDESDGVVPSTAMMTSSAMML